MTNRGDSGGETQQHREHRRTGEHIQSPSSEIPHAETVRADSQTVRAAMSNQEGLYQNAHSQNMRAGTGGL